MLTAEENALICQVGENTPMGVLMRRYWLPTLLSSELPGAGCPPVRIRVLGEDLVGFRDGQGRVGLMHTQCAHRGAPLYYGRSEPEGIRCVYHGWMYDVSGSCIDMPNEPEESNFRNKVSIRAYPCQERNGVLWTYMGPEELPPPLPSLEWNMVPMSQSYVTKRVMECNYLQALEGEIDSSHSAFLHSRIGENTFSAFPTLGTARSQGEFYRMRVKRPKFQVAETELGIVIGASYPAEENSDYWRATQFLLPFHTIIPPYGKNPPLSGHAWLPMDDQHTMSICFTYHPTTPLSQEQLAFMKYAQNGIENLHPSMDGFEDAPVLGGDARWRPRINRSNHYLMDWEAQESERYSGLPGVWPQDTAMQEGMGPIFDRTREHLGTTDLGIIRVRRKLLSTAKALYVEGLEPPGALNGDWYFVRSASTLVSKGESWVEATAPLRKAQEGISYDAV